MALEMLIEKYLYRSDEYLHALLTAHKSQRLRWFVRQEVIHTFAVLCNSPRDSSRLHNV